MFERVRDSYEFPADIGGDDDPGALRWTATVIAVTAGLLALFNAQALTGWAEDLPPGPAAMKLVAAATAWEDATGSLGLPHARMHKAWKQVERAEWTPRPPEVQQASR
jgi:hypothetical protein